MDWFWFYLSKNKNLSRVNIQDNIRKKLNWYKLAEHPSITWDIICQNKDIPWVKYYVSINLNITWEIIRDNMSFPWNWKGIAENVNITEEIVKNNLNYPWEWEYLIKNHNMSFDFIRERENYRVKMFREYLAAYKIQQWWFKITLSPQFKVGRKLIEKKRAELLD